MWGLLAGGIASSIAGGIIGGNDAKKAQRLQESYINRGLARFGDARGAVDDAEMAALTDADAANAILAGIEPAVLEGLDEQLRIRVAQQMMRQEQEAAMTNQRLAAAGLDSTTVMPQVQRTQARAQGDAMGSLAAQFAGMRSQALANSRSMQAQGLMQRAGMVGNFGAQRANLYAQEAGMLGGVQIQAPNTGAAIGQIGGMLMNAWGADKVLASMNQQESVSGIPWASPESMKAIGFGGGSNMGGYGGSGGTPFSMQRLGKLWGF